MKRNALLKKVSPIRCQALGLRAKRTLGVFQTVSDDNGQLRQ